MHALSQLTTLTSRILNAKKDDYSELFFACDKLYDTLLSITGELSSDTVNRQNLELESGKALGLTWAAMCVKDLMRTKRFMDAVYEAARDRLENYPGRPVQLLYAGTGPFATLALPLIAAFPSDQIQFTLLEVNKTSYNCLQKLIGVLQIEKYIHHIEQADATTWKIPGNDQIDIFICETMQQGLNNEPQVSIGLNIVPQLYPGAIMIPNQVILKAALLNPQKRMHEKMQGIYSETAILPLQTVFTLNREILLEYGSAGKPSVQSFVTFPGTSLFIHEEQASNYPVLCLLTEIEIYNQQKLLLDESALTLPLKLADLKKGQQRNLKFQYQTGKEPGVRFVDV